MSKSSPDSAARLAFFVLRAAIAVVRERVYLRGRVRDDLANFLRRALPRSGAHSHLANHGVEVRLVGLERGERVHVVTVRDDELAQIDSEEQGGSVLGVAAGKPKDAEGGAPPLQQPIGHDAVIVFPRVRDRHDPLVVAVKVFFAQLQQVAQLID